MEKIAAQAEFLLSANVLVSSSARQGIQGAGLGTDHADVIVPQYKSSQNITSTAQGLNLMMHFVSDLDGNGLEWSALRVVVEDTGGWEAHAVRVTGNRIQTASSKITCQLSPGVNFQLYVQFAYKIKMDVDERPSFYD